MDESSLEQQICESNDHTLIVRKTGLVESVSKVSRLSDENLVKVINFLKN